MRPIGIEERDTSAGIHIFRVNYIADAMKREESVLDDLAQGMPGGRTGRMWRQEMEGDWHVASGLGVYSEYFNRDIHVSREPLRAHRKLPMYRGWDIGPTHQFPAVVIAQVDDLGRCCVLDEIASWDGRNDPKAVDVGVFAELVILRCNQDFPGVEWIDYADSAGWTKSMTDNRSCIDALQDRGVHPLKGPVTMQARKDAMVKRLSTMVAGRPALAVDPCCIMLIEAFGGLYRYQEIGGTGRYTSQIEKNAVSHPMNGLEYVVGSLYTVRTNEPKENRIKSSRRDPVTGY